MSDDYILEMLWQAQMGNTNYPFESQATRAKQVPKYTTTFECRHSWYESR